MTASRAHSDILSPNNVYPVNFPQYFATITVVNRGINGIIWLRTDGLSPVVFAANNPSLSDDNYPVLPGQAQTFPNGVLLQEPVTRTISGTQIQLISDTPVPFTVYAT